MDETIKLLIQRLSDLETKYQELEKKHEELTSNYVRHSHKVFIATNESNHSTRSYYPSFGEPESVLHSAHHQRD
jgi:hypothetical protein